TPSGSVTLMVASSNSTRKRDSGMSAVRDRQHTRAASAAMPTTTMTDFLGMRLTTRRLSGRRDTPEHDLTSDVGRPVLPADRCSRGFGGFASVLLRRSRRLLQFRHPAGKVGGELLRPARVQLRRFLIECESVPRPLQVFTDPACLKVEESLFRFRTDASLDHGQGLFWPCLGQEL